MLRSALILAAALLSVLWMGPLRAEEEKVSRFVEIIAPLIDPAKLDTLKGDRAANRRLRKIAHHLETAPREGSPPEEPNRRRTGQPGGHWDCQRQGSESIAHPQHGHPSEAGMAKLRTGNAPTITLGPYAGDIASVDHIIPRSVCEELDERLYNLEFMPSRMNSSKGNKITMRQVQLGRKWNKIGLLSNEGLAAVESRFKE